ncbi:hypothetical protein LCGC14_1784380 [marine sediment metagenome]|uniref:Uncharacterized protein n=1 Tax=marine sediment metagenome TaxID=412755 RepID=A0A0F9GUJ4_9ZZZZ
MVNIISKIIQELNKRLNRERFKEHLSYLIEKRFTNEKMLQLEILNIISNIPEVKDYMPEMPYNYNNAIKCDIWFSLQDGKECWIEVKMRSTNYHKKELHGKAIKKGIDGIIKDIDRLKKAKGNKFIIFAFYPIYQDSVKFFKKHLI